MRDQVRELLTGSAKSTSCGSTSLIPGKFRDSWESEKMVAMIRELQPHIILNNRWGCGTKRPFEVDVSTPEQTQPEDGCDATMNLSCGKRARLLAVLGLSSRRNDVERPRAIDSNADFDRGVWW
jgi:hypothetical protein